MVDWEYRDALCPHCCSMTPCAYNKLNNKYLCRWCSKTFTIRVKDFNKKSNSELIMLIKNKTDKLGWDDLDTMTDILEERFDHD